MYKCLKCEVTLFVLIFLFIKKLLLFLNHLNVLLLVEGASINLFHLYHIFKVLHGSCANL